MELMNIEYGKKVIHIEYEYEETQRRYIFAEDIKLGNWTIYKQITIGGPRSSPYKYDFKNYAEFTITDKHGESRIKRHYYNSCAIKIKTGNDYADSVAEYGVRLFLENHPIFEAKDWADYDVIEQLSAIEGILSDTTATNFDKLVKIRELFK